MGEPSGIMMDACRVCAEFADDDQHPIQYSGVNEKWLHVYKHILPCRPQLFSAFGLTSDNRQQIEVMRADGACRKYFKRCFPNANEQENVVDTTVTISTDSDTGGSSTDAKCTESTENNVVELQRCTGVSPPRMKRSLTPDESKPNTSTAITDNSKCSQTTDKKRTSATTEEEPPKKKTTSQLQCDSSAEIRRLVDVPDTNETLPLATSTPCRNLNLSIPDAPSFTPTVLTRSCLMCHRSIQQSPAPKAQHVWHHLHKENKSSWICEAPDDTRGVGQMCNRAFFQQLLLKQHILRDHHIPREKADELMRNNEPLYAEEFKEMEKACFPEISARRAIDVLRRCRKCDVDVCDLERHLFSRHWPANTVLPFYCKGKTDEGAACTFTSGVLEDYTVHWLEAHQGYEMVIGCNYKSATRMWRKMRECYDDVSME